jgi:hypothetical protein
MLTSAQTKAYAIPVTVSPVAGIGVPNAAAVGRHVVTAFRLFSCLGAPIFYGWPGGEGHKARRCRTGTPISVRSLSQLALGERLKTVCGITNMNTSIPGASAPISPESLTVIAYRGQPIVTTAMLAKLYGAAEANIQDNHRRNSERFEEGKHFHKLEGEALREFKKSLTGLNPVSSTQYQIGKHTRSLILWTERGAARHAKMLDTEQAWEVFERLEDCYFQRKETAQSQTKALPEPPADPFTKEVHSAINRRAHALSLRHYDWIKEQLREAIRKWGKDLEGQKLLELIQTIDLPDSQLVIVHRNDLWALTYLLGSLDELRDKAMAALHKIEADTGMMWHNREH